MKTAEFLPAPPLEEIVYSIPEGDEETLTAADKAAEAAVEQLSSNAEKGQVIRIYRQLGTGRESMEFIAKYPADKFSIDDLIEKMQVEYGGGDYRFMIYNEKGKIAANKLISIAKKLEKTTEENSGLYGLLQGIMDRQDNFSRVLLAKQNEGGSNRLEMLQEMVVMKGLFSNDQKDSGNVMSQLKELMEAMELLKTMGGNNEDSDSGFAGIFKESIPLLQTIAEAAKQPAPNPGKSSGNSQGEKTMDISFLFKHTMKLCRENRPTREVAELICRELTDENIAKLEKIILMKDPLATITLFQPDIAMSPHKEWFLDLVQWLRGYLGYDSIYDAEFIDTGPDSEDLTPGDDKNTIDLDEFANPDINGDSQRKSGDTHDT